MFNFLKKLFGFDTAVYKEAGVELEQVAPYKVPEPVITPAAEVAPMVEVKEDPKPAAPVMTAAKKAPAIKKPAGRKPAAKKPATKSTAGRKKTTK